MDLEARTSGLAANLGVTLDLSRQPDDVIGLLQWRDGTLDA